MVRLMGKLTAKEVEKKTAAGLYGDGGGLTLQVTKAGVKSWLYRYMIEGKAYGMGLGPVHTITLAQARQLATDARRMVIDGINPLENKRKIKLSAAQARGKLMTFDQCASAYIDAHRSSWKNAKHADQWTNTLATYASPLVGSMPVGEVDTAWVVKVLTQKDSEGRQFWATKTETATRVRGRIEQVLGWATTSGFRTGDNPARWKGHLDNLLATISKGSRTVNHPSLDWQRMGGFVQALRQRSGVAARTVEFTILTASRSGEARGAKWSEIDLEAKIWTIPAVRMKAKREHQIPLSNEAVALIDRMEHVKGSDLIFPNTKGGVLSDMSMTAVIRRMNAELLTWASKDGKPVTVHGFRSSFRMWAAESTNFPREVAEHALSHQLPDAVERAYQRGTQFSKRAQMMQEWAKYCGTVRSDGGEVVPINRAAG